MVHPYENDLITVLTEIHDEVQYADDCLIFSTGTELSKTLIDLQKTNTSIKNHFSIHQLN